MLSYTFIFTYIYLNDGYGDCSDVHIALSYGFKQLL